MARRCSIIFLQLLLLLATLIFAVSCKEAAKYEVAEIFPWNGEVVFSAPPPSQVKAGDAILSTITIQDEKGVIITDSDDELIIRCIDSSTLQDLAICQGPRTVRAASGVVKLQFIIKEVISGVLLEVTPSKMEKAKVLSTPFDIVPNDPVKLKFIQPPTEQQADVIFSPAVSVGVYDAYDNLVDVDDAKMKISFSSDGTPAGCEAAVISGSEKLSVDGIATFEELKIDLRCDGYKVFVREIENYLSGLAIDTSTTFNIPHGVPDHISFSGQPADETPSDQAISGIKVALRDSAENIVTLFSGSFTMNIDTDPTGNSILSGTRVKKATRGEAIFSDLKIDNMAEGFKLIATGYNETMNAVSDSFNIIAGSPYKLAFANSPTSDVQAGSVIAEQIAVKILDVNGNPASATNAITIAFPNNTPSGTLTSTAVAGTAFFSGISLTRASATQTITASATGLVSKTSSPFEIYHRAGPLHIEFSTTNLGTAYLGNPVASFSIRLHDQYHNPAIYLNSSATVSLISQPDPPPSQLSWTTSFVDGEARFGNIYIDKPFEYYTFAATTTEASSTSTSVTRGPLRIRPGTATKIAIATAPSPTEIAGETISSIKIEARDSSNFLNTTTTGTINVRIKAGTGNSGTLLGTTSRALAGGAATFSDLKINQASWQVEGASPYTLEFYDSATLYAVINTSLEIKHSSADHIDFITTASDITAGVEISPQIAIQDLYHNLVSSGTSATANISLALVSSTASASLEGTAEAMASAGLANFLGQNITILKSALTNTLVATCELCTNHSASSNSFSVYPATASKIVIESAIGSAYSTPSTFNNATLTAGDTITLYAISRDSNDNYVASVNANWGLTSINGSLSTSTGTSTSFTAKWYGTTTIEADYGALEDSTGIISVNPGAATHVTIETAPAANGTATNPLPASTTMHFDDSLTLYAAARDNFENYVSSLSVNWSLTAQDVGGLNPLSASNQTTLTALSAGTSSIVASGTLGSVTSSAIVVAAPTQIYRSVGSTGEVANGSIASIALAISNSQAFATTSLPEGISPGDVLVFDSDDDAEVDSLAIIEAISDNTSLALSTADGAEIASELSMNSSESWSIYRAYTSLAQAERGAENSAIATALAAAAALANFDTFNDATAQDLVASYQEWNLLCQDNSSLVDTTPLVVAGWTTGPYHHLKISSPQKNYTLQATTRIETNYSEMRGLKLEVDSTGPAIIYSSSTPSGEITFVGNILSSKTSGSLALGLTIETEQVVARINNNIFYNIVGSGVAINTSSTENDSFVHLANNTLFDVGALGNSVAQSDYVQLATSYNLLVNSGGLDADSENSNVSSADSSIFVDAANKDFHLDPSANAAIDIIPINVVTANPSIDYLQDIDGENRPSNTGALWDVGADEIVE
ncbi:MAG: hypothetical protein A2504_00150 [Bdellovibrionales bacterium RIFOXYD12_FULL_39_22]|nr:MAG: hypothetical protein A2385_14875 [Bdellovibrionales bacterium RIFOXYB1_FULL_39_21]OFZ48104.1 MAG: hypothetical protein A2404_15790 [Bdellovibrionales bacterium RIFOXYC1_FULL_39_130]OFZ77233.1 MAG: hypothetical protein A2560_08195 [Bdellovibrionales bacterium RIFOXYD1_FULL_39_84]OFZ95707.1 MAG: hypothetical protein A2504_00150 [Bdellovibrionales bacterium RIFOXYD12_FULL_39_22]HLE11478.1 hypothetical protein [Bacteriovoracaceae bacterium]